MHKPPMKPARPLGTASMPDMLQQTIFPIAHSHPPVLEALALSGGPEGQDLLCDITLQLPAGVSALTGDEGVGKTSLLRLLSGDLSATAGDMILRGKPWRMGHPHLASVFWADLRMPLHDEDTPLQCWSTWQQNLPLWSKDMQQALVEALHMTPHLNKRLNMLSTGSRRKVGLITALAAGATVTLLDQPFVSLDHASIRVLKDVLTDAAEHTERAWLVADYEAPADIPLASLLQL